MPHKGPVGEKGYGIESSLWAGQEIALQNAGTKVLIKFAKFTLETVAGVGGRGGGGGEKAHPRQQVEQQQSKQKNNNKQEELQFILKKLNSLKLFK